MLVFIYLKTMPFQFDKGHKEESNIDSFGSDDDDVVSEVGDDELNQMVQVRTSFEQYLNFYYNFKYHQKQIVKIDLLQ